MCTHARLDDGRTRKARYLAERSQCEHALVEILKRLAGTAVKIDVERFQSNGVKGRAAFLLTVLRHAIKRVVSAGYKLICMLRYLVNTAYKALANILVLPIILDANSAIGLALGQ